MDRYYQADAVATAPDLTKLNSQGYPTNGDPALGIPATMPGEGWFYTITEELMNVIESSGLTPDKTDPSQLDAAIRAIINSVLNSAVPTGLALPFGGSVVPDGWLLANGAAVSRTTFANLFSVYGTTHGAGDGSTTFNLPDLRDRYIIGADTNALGTKIAEQLPNIKGSYQIQAEYLTLQAGAFLGSDTSRSTGFMRDSTFNTIINIDFKANNSNSIYTDNGKVYPLSVALNFIIKA
jgi:microcystin-dependent protein